MYKAYKYRIYPNREQEQIIQKTFGCCRFVYNNLLARRIELYENEKKTLSKFDTTKIISNELKTNYPFLKEVDSIALNNAAEDLDSAYQNFFRRVKKGEVPGFPKFKRKGEHFQSYRTNKIGKSNNIMLVNEDGKHYIKLPKLTPIEIVLHRELIGEIKNATIMQIESGKYYIAIVAELPSCRTLPDAKGSVGIDTGLKTLATLSDGTTYENIKVIKKYEEKLAKLSRQLSHKTPGSKNYEKARRKLARCHEKITNTRKDYLNKVSHDIVRNNNLIAVETLNVKEMLKDNSVADINKAIADASMSELVRQIEYKAEWNDRTFVKLDSIVPTGRTCSVCGAISEGPSDISSEYFICSSCGEKINRHENSSKVILAEALKYLDDKDSYNKSLAEAKKTKNKKVRKNEDTKVY